MDLFNGSFPSVEGNDLDVSDTIQEPEELDIYDDEMQEGRAAQTWQLSADCTIKDSTILRDARRQVSPVL